MKPYVPIVNPYVPKRGGGKRKDRVFKIHIEIPDGVEEDKVMDMIEEAVASHSTQLGINPESISVKRNFPKYSEMK